MVAKLKLWLQMVAKLKLVRIDAATMVANREGLFWQGYRRNLTSALLLSCNEDLSGRPRNLTSYSGTT